MTEITTEPPPTTGRPAPASPQRRRFHRGDDQHAGVTGEVPKSFVDEVVADAASRAGVDESSVVVTTAAAVQWPDGSLGCPEPGVMYTQAIVDGSQIVVQAGGETYDYRLDGRASSSSVNHRSGN